MRREFLLDSLTDIDPQYIDEGGELLLGGAKRRPGARLITTVLIAAARMAESRMPAMKPGKRRVTRSMKMTSAAPTSA